MAARPVRVRGGDPEDRSGEVQEDRAARAVRGVPDRATGRRVVTRKVALVTGGASGIGRAIVERLEAEGAEVRVLDIVDGFDVSDAQAWESVGPVDLACLQLGIARPSYERVRVLVRRARERGGDPSTAGVLVDVATRARPPKALLDHISGIGVNSK